MDLERANDCPAVQSVEYTQLLDSIARLVRNFLFLLLFNPVLSDVGDVTDLKYGGSDSASMTSAMAGDARHAEATFPDEAQFDAPFSEAVSQKEVR